jgi:hypothetical protein
MTVLAKTSSNISDESVGKLVGLLRRDRWYGSTRLHGVIAEMTVSSHSVPARRNRVQTVRCFAETPVIKPEVLGAAGDPG